MYQNLQQISVTEYINDYLEFGIFNGLYAVNAYMTLWDNAKEAERKIYFAKMVAEYGRAIEEAFAHIYAMAMQSKSIKLVYWKYLVNYKTQSLNNFILKSDFTDIFGLLGFAELDKLASKLNFDKKGLANALSEASDLLLDIRNERITDSYDNDKGRLQQIYNKLKHPCLLYSVTPDNSKCGFGVMTSADKTSSTSIEIGMPFSFTPMMATKDAAGRIQENVNAITHTLMLLMKCFVATYQIRSRE